jgi:L-asparagine oxygenase
MMTLAAANSAPPTEHAEPEIPDPPSFTLAAEDAGALAAVADRLASEHRTSRMIDDHELLMQAEVAMRQASSELLSALIEFRLRGSSEGAMLLRGLPLDDPLPNTPWTGVFTGAWQELTRSTVAQLMIMSVLGDVVSYAEEKQGRLVQDICRVHGAGERSCENSEGKLVALRTENPLHPHRPDFVSLLALRADHGRNAVTVAGGIRAVLPQLDPETVMVLRQPWYRIRLDASSASGGRPRYSRPTAVLSGSLTDPDLAVDFDATEGVNAAARDALEALRGRMLGALVGAVLEPGSMLIVDNRKAVHGRTGFATRCDGRDRWVRQCFAVSNLRASQAMRYPGSRVLRRLNQLAR